MESTDSDYPRGCEVKGTMERDGGGLVEEGGEAGERRVNVVRLTDRLETVGL